MVVSLLSGQEFVEIEEPNLYELIEHIIREKQQMKDQIEELKKEINLLKKTKKND